MLATSLGAGRRILANALSSFHLNNPKDGLNGVLARSGSLEARLARGKKDVRRAQRLRFKVFYKEGGAILDPKAALTRRDADRFDKHCDHLIVIDRAARNRFGKVKPKVVGAYRLLRSDVANAKCGFYSESEYRLGELMRRHPEKRFLELGRSCVLSEYRGKHTIDLLWRGLLAYIRHHDIDALFGCASFDGANPLRHAAALSYLVHHARADDEWSVRAQDAYYTPMDILSREAVDPKRALASLPPLIKGYLRVGARFGDGAVIDRKLNTVDVFVIMPVDKMDTRYSRHFGVEGADKHAA